MLVERPDWGRDECGQDTFLYICGNIITCNGPHISALNRLSGMWNKWNENFDKKQKSSQNCVIGWCQSRFSGDNIIDYLMKLSCFVFIDGLACLIHGLHGRVMGWIDGRSNEDGWRKWVKPCFRSVCKILAVCFSIFV